MKREIIAQLYCSNCHDHTPHRYWSDWLGMTHRRCIPCQTRRRLKREKFWRLLLWKF